LRRDFVVCRLRAVRHACADSRQAERGFHEGTAIRGPAAAHDGADDRRCPHEPRRPHRVHQGRDRPLGEGGEGSEDPAAVDSPARHGSRVTGHFFMNTLLAASAFFLLTHFVPSTPLRRALVKALGEWPYRGLYSLVALAGIV